VISTVSSDEKASLPLAAGAEHAVNYRASEAADEIRALVPKGVDVIVEVAPAGNAASIGPCRPERHRCRLRDGRRHRARVERARTDVP
jgi:hypothetical protein